MEGTNALVSKYVLNVPKIYEQRWRTASSAFFPKFLQVPPSSYFSLRMSLSASKFLLIP